MFFYAVSISLLTYCVVVFVLLSGVTINANIYIQDEYNNILKKYGFGLIATSDISVSSSFYADRE